MNTRHDPSPQAASRETPPTEPGRERGVPIGAVLGLALVVTLAWVAALVWIGERLLCVLF